jgi:DNA-binding NtrC family response regulator
MKVVRVLIADDDPDYRGIVARILSSWDYDVVQASSGNEALETVRSKECDIVILDYLMPEMDGVEALRKIREIDADIPVIMSTAHPDNRSISGTEELKVFAYIPKSSVFTDPKTSLRSAIEMAQRHLSEK